MFYHTDPEPYLCIVALDDMRLKSAAQQRAVSPWQHAYVTYAVTECNHRGFTTVTRHALNIPHYIVAPILYPPPYFATSFARGDAHTAWKQYLRCCWHNNPPSYTNRQPPQWSDDSQPARNYVSSDRTLLTYRARAMIGGVKPFAAGTIICPRCNNELQWRCSAHANFVSFHCDDDCIQLEERPGA